MTAKKFFSVLAFCATIIIAFVLAFRAIFNNNPQIINALMIIAECISTLITIICAYSFVKDKKHSAWKIIYAVAVTAIVALLIVVNII